MSAYDPSAKDIYHYYVEFGFDDDFDFLGEDGQPLFMDYGSVDWKGLSSGIRALMDGLSDSMGMYLANEPIDVSDANAEQAEGEDGDLSGRMNQVFSLLEVSDYRSGVLDLAQYRHILHPIKFPQDAAPPAIGLIVAVKGTISQMSEWESAVCRPFGHLPVLQTTYTEDGETPRDPCIESMDPALHRLLVEHLGLPYKHQCAMSFLVRRPA